MLRLSKRSKGRALIPILIGVGVLLLIIGIVGLVWAVKSFSEVFTEEFAGFDDYMEEGTGKGIARVEISPTNTLWLELDGEKVRWASAKEELADQEWAEFEYDLDAESRLSPDIEIPLMGEKPNGWEAAYISFRSSYGSSYDVFWYVDLIDDQGSTWIYLFESSLWLSEYGDSVERLSLPDAKYPNFTVMFQSSFDKDGFGAKGKPTVGMGVTMTAYDNYCQGITKNGEPVPVKLRLLDDTGKEVASAEKELRDLGFG